MMSANNTKIKVKDINLYPIIEHYDDLAPFIEGREDIREFIADMGDHRFRTVCYMIATDDTFTEPMRRECRGIVFDDKTGKLLARPFHKFFNINEGADNHVNVIANSVIESVLEKLDGSLITPVVIDRCVYFKTKKAFESPAALMAKDVALDCHYDLIRHEDDCGYTPMFELTSPDAMIVVPYASPSLTLIASRNIKTGEYRTYENLCAIAESFGTPVVKAVNFNGTTRELIDQNWKDQGKEGLVLVLESGQRVKLKTEWYCDIHHVMTFWRERDIAKACVNETIDDLISMIPKEDMRQAAMKVKRKFDELYYGFIREVKDLAKEIEEMEPRARYIAYGDHPFFKQACNELKGIEIDYKELYRTRLLKEDFGLHRVEGNEYMEKVFGPVDSQGKQSD